MWELQRPYNNQVTAVPKAQINHDAPVLCTDFSSDGSTVFSGGANKQVGYGVQTYYVGMDYENILTYCRGSTDVVGQVYG